MKHTYYLLYLFKKMLALLCLRVRVPRIQTNNSSNLRTHHALSNRIKTPVRYMSMYQIRYEYFNPERAEQLHIKNTNVDHVKVKCYFNGIYWCCPNPKDSSRVSNVHDQYLKGRFFKFHTYNIPVEDFENKDNWNS